MLKINEFHLKINGSEYIEFMGASCARSMDAMGSSFQINLFDPERIISGSFSQDLPCQIYLNGVMVIDGHLERLDISDVGGTVFTYTGRDLAGDLIDCSAMFDGGGFEMKNVTLETVVKSVLKPFNMPLTIIGDDGKKFDKISIEPSETVHAFIDRICRYRGMFPLTDGVGGLVITTAGSRRSTGQIVYGENVISRTGSISHNSRFSPVIVKGQAPALSLNPDKTAKNEGRSVDYGLTRHRPKIIIAEKAGYDKDLQGRADWEVAHRKKLGTKLTYTVTGWEASEGKLWKINQLVPVTDKVIGIHQDMLISGVNFERSDNGTITKLTVVPAETYKLPARKQADDNQLWGGV